MMKHEGALAPQAFHAAHPIFGASTHVTQCSMWGRMRIATPEPVLQLSKLLLQGGLLGAAGLQRTLCLSPSTALSIQLRTGDM